MEFDEKETGLLRVLGQEWNAAEEAIKIAEKAASEFGSPAVLELRYAGRKIVEAISLIDNPAPPQTSAAKLQDAICDCHRARHDATDHATTEITLKLDLALEQFGQKEVRTVFPEFAKLRSELASIRQVVSDSRKDRNARGEFYTKLEQEKLPQVMVLFERFLVAEIELESGAFYRWMKNTGGAYGWVLAIVVAVLLWWFSK